MENKLLLSILVLAAFFNSINATWIIPKGYANWVNVSDPNYNTTYFGANIITDYVLVPFNISIPSIHTGGGLVVLGYNASKDFIGNITGFIYTNGLLLSKYTLQGKSWTYATIWYNNQQYTNSLCTTSYNNGTIEPCNNNTINQYFINALMHNTSGTGNPLIAIGFYGNKSLVSFSNISNNGYSGYIQAKIYLNKIPYFFTIQQLANSIYLNYSLHFVPGDPSSDGYVLNENSTLPVHLAAVQTLGNKILTSNTLNFSMYLSNYADFINTPQLVGAGYGIYHNGTAYNATTTAAPAGLFFQTPPFIFNFYYPNLSKYTSAQPALYYLFVPAFTTNVLTSNTLTNSTNAPVATNKTLNTTSSSVITWNYNITNINWTYTFKTNNLYGNHNYTFSTHASYLILNLTQYTQMDLNGACANVNITAYNANFSTSLGAARYGLISSKNGTCSYVISNYTTTGYSNPPSLKVQFYSIPEADHLNSSIVSSFMHTYLGSGTSAYNSYSIPEATQILKLSDPIIPSNTGIYQNIQYDNSAGAVNNAEDIIAQGTSYDNIAQNYEGNLAVIPIANYLIPTTSTIVLYILNIGNQYSNTYSVYTKSAVYFAQGQAGNYKYLVNNESNYSTNYLMAWRYNDYGEATGINQFLGLHYNLSYNENITSMQPYTTSYILGNLSVIASVSKSGTSISGAPQPLNSNNTLPKPILNFTQNNINTTLKSLGLNTIINFNGFTIPKYLIAILLIIIAIIVFGLMQEDGIIFTLILLWLAGFFAFTNIGYLIITIFAILVYIGYTFTRREDKNGN